VNSRATPHRAEAGRRRQGGGAGSPDPKSHKSRTSTGMRACPWARRQLTMSKIWELAERRRKHEAAYVRCDGV
jgi:hypothetical protein